MVMFIYSCRNCNQIKCAHWNLFDFRDAWSLLSSSMWTICMFTDDQDVIPSCYTTTSNQHQQYDVVSFSDSRFQTFSFALNSIICTVDYKWWYFVCHINWKNKIVTKPEKNIWTKAIGFWYFSHANKQNKKIFTAKWLFRHPSWPNDVINVNVFGLCM